MSEMVMDVARTLQLRRRLYLVGWRGSETERLLRFLNTYQSTPDDIAGLDVKRLEFVRYLVQTGRIKDE